MNINICLQVVQEYERAVIFRLGRLRKGGAKVRPLKVCSGTNMWMFSGTRNIFCDTLCGPLPVCGHADSVLRCSSTGGGKNVFHSNVESAYLMCLLFQY